MGKLLNGFFPALGRGLLNLTGHSWCWLVHSWRHWQPSTTCSSCDRTDCTHRYSRYKWKCDVCGEHWRPLYKHCIGPGM